VKTIDTLVRDIYDLVKTRGWFTDEIRNDLEGAVGRRLQEKFNEDKGPPTLRMSRLGPVCPKALWYSIHEPGLAVPLHPWTEIKYSIGHIVEAQAIAFAKAAGHRVEGEQDAIQFDGITGHRDCVIDGMVVDVKSTSTRGFEKFKTRALEKDDAFGYLNQLDGYVLGSSMDPLVQVKDEGALLVVDPILGHMLLYRHGVTNDRARALKERIADYKRVVAMLSPPPCECRTIPQGSSGNIQLDVRASYSPYKYCCRPHLRTFIYANGPVYLTNVVRKPDVREVNKHGKTVFNS